MARRTKRRRDRIDVQPTRTGSSIASIVAIVLTTCVVIGLVPATGLLVVLQNLSNSAGDAVHIQIGGQITLAGLLTVTFFASNGIGAYAKSVCARRWMSAPSLVALNIGMFASVIIFAVSLQALVAGLHSGADNDNGKLLVAFAVWVWAVWNATGPIFAELRDRMAAWVDVKVSA